MDIAVVDGIAFAPDGARLKERLLDEAGSEDEERFDSMLAVEERFESCQLCPRRDCPNRRRPYDEGLFARRFAARA